MGKGGGSQTVTSVPDAGTTDYVQRMRNLALSYAGQPGQNAPQVQTADQIQQLRAKGGIWADLADQMQAKLGPLGAAGPTAAPPLPAGIQNAIGQYGQYANAGQQGLAALSGDAGAQAQYMNPFLSQMNPFFAQQRQQAIEGANQQATLAGAFGGDRSQIGAAVAGNQADQTQAGFNYQGFLEAMQRAQNAAQMGFGAIGAGAFLPQMYQQGQLNLLGSAIGPYGQTQSQQMHSDPWSQLLGLGATAEGLFLGGPAGAAAGGAFAPGFGAGFGPPTPGQVW